MRPPRGSAESSLAGAAGAAGFGTGRPDSAQVRPARPKPNGLTTFLMFGDLHGRILPAFRLAAVWAGEADRLRTFTRHNWKWR